VNYRVNKKGWDGVGLIWCDVGEKGGDGEVVRNGCLQVFAGTNAYDSFMEGRWPRARLLNHGGEGVGRRPSRGRHRGWRGRR
jgi:hypothetical protein